MISKDLFFALDIGTRTVVGIVGREEDGKLNIIASEIVEHKSRAMMDGQVHDIGKVAEAVLEVKTSLENKLNIKLEKAAIAAAGRVLKTKQVHVETSINNSRTIDSEIISSLEMEGLQIAQYELDEDMDSEEKVLYYCVGYSVINYYLNSYVISNLEGHRGRKIGADIIATFLPNTVVDSLYAVMGIAELEVSNLTLEPIAAINVAIPKDLRLLNLALVDIGAGTSDIAITREGTIVGFDMVPVAGDEITEAICHKYIVDFNTAEKIKTTKCGLDEEISFCDILGISRKITMREIIESISDSIEHLAETIADKIVEFNKKSPQAVFLIGGGSQVINLDKLIARRLSIPEERVAVRKSSIIQNVVINETKLEGPEAVTPIGIAVTALTQPGYGFIKVKVNEMKIRLFNSRKLHVADAAVVAGIKPKELIGKNGRNLKFEVNGVSRLAEGGLSKPSEIRVNGAAGNLQTPINNGDNIIIKRAEDGEDPVIKVRSLLDEMPHNENSKYEIIVNGSYIFNDYIVRDGDRIQIIEGSASVNDEEVSAAIKKEEVTVTPDTAETGIMVTVNGEVVALYGKERFIFVDIFDFYYFDLKVLRGRLVTLINGKSASFTEALNDGDIIDIRWE